MRPSSDLIRETLKSGTIASLAMMPFGFILKALDLRVGHYGPKFAELFIDNPGTVLLFAQHIFLGWLSALPLLIIIRRTPRLSAMFMGALYGALYYVAINSLLLPLYFGDPTPWELGVEYILPSLFVHIVFGVTIGYTATTTSSMKPLGVQSRI